MDKDQQLSDFDKGQIVMALHLGVSVSETAGLVGCSEAAVEEIVGETAKEEGTSTEEKDGEEKKGRRRPRKKPKV